MLLFLPLLSTFHLQIYYFWSVLASSHLIVASSGLGYSSPCLRLTWWDEKRTGETEIRREFTGNLWLERIHMLQLFTLHFFLRSFHSSLRSSFIYLSSLPVYLYRILGCFVPMSRVFSLSLQFTRLPRSSLLPSPRHLLPSCLSFPSLALSVYSWWSLVRYGNGTSEWLRRKKRDPEVIKRCNV